MKPTRVIWATFLMMITVQTVSSIDGQHRLPAPKRFVAISVVWGTLFFAAEIGLGKLAARLSLLILLTAMVVGPFGKLVINFLTTITKTFAIPPAQDSGVPGTPGIPGTPGVSPSNPRTRLA